MIFNWDDLTSKHHIPNEKMCEVKKGLTLFNQCPGLMNSMFSFISVNQKSKCRSEIELKLDQKF